jgi:hypothetical protein
MLDEATQELPERWLDHQSGEAEVFHRSLPGPVRVGIDPTEPIRCFDGLLAELGHVPTHPRHPSEPLVFPDGRRPHRPLLTSSVFSRSEIVGEGLKAALRLRHRCIGCHPLCAAGASCVCARHVRTSLQNQATVERMWLQAEAREVTVAPEIGRVGATVVRARRIMPR